jgi:predicted nucleic acid-binding protein
LAGAAVDTNILVFAAGLRRVEADEAKIAKSISLIAELTRSQLIRIPAQALAELRHVLIRRSGRDSNAVSNRMAKYLALGEAIPTSHSVLQEAFQLAADHHLQTYDAIILAAAAQAGCDILYSEDMQHGFEWNGVLVVNPFA